MAMASVWLRLRSDPNLPLDQKSDQRGAVLATAEILRCNVHLAF